MIKEIIFVRHAETEMNLKNLRYDNFGPDEYYPITERGKLMAKETGEFLTKYGDFDIIYTSPRDRCIQTAEIIANEIKYNGKIKKSDLLLESNAGKTNLMSHEQIGLFIAKNDKLIKQLDAINLEQNEFKLITMKEEHSRDFCKYTEETNYETIEKQYEKFLSKISESKYNRILVVCHSGTIHIIKNIVLNLGYQINIKICVRLSCEDYFNENCVVMGLMFRDAKFYMVIPPNTQHLKNLAKRLLNLDKNIYIIRHGETDWNKLGLIQGSENDNQLNDNGRVQAKNVGEFLKSEFKSKPNKMIDLILTSPMIRAKETANIIADVIGFSKENIVVNNDLIEIGQGLIANGESMNDLRTNKFYDEFFDLMTEYNKLTKLEKLELIDDIPDIFIKKYKMESNNSVFKRVNAAIDYIKKLEAKNILIVSHNGTINFMNKSILNSVDTIKGDLSKGSNCHVTIYKYNSDDNKFKLIMAPTTYFLK